MGVAETGQDRVGRGQRALQAQHVVPGFGAGQDMRAHRPIGEDHRNRLQPDLRDLVDGDRQDIRRQAVAEAGQRVDERRDMLAVMEQHDGILPTGFPVGEQQRAERAQQRVGGAERVGRGTGRAGGGELPHPAHACGSMATWSPAGAMAPVGHSSKQRLQPAMREREWAQRLSWKLT